jgi:shikimate kinase
VLIGLPGAGKTTVGRALAERLGRPFLDFDEELERREGRTVAAIFAERGEPWFRELERGLTRELANAPPMVLSPGGGWVANEGCVALLRPAASIIYLAASPATALARLGRARDARPLLQGPDPLATLRGLLARREAGYRAADHVIETDLLDVQGVIERIVVLATSKVGE